MSGISHLGKSCSAGARHQVAEVVDCLVKVADSHSVAAFVEAVVVCYVDLKSFLRSYPQRGSSPRAECGPESQNY